MMGIIDIFAKLADIVSAFAMLYLTYSIHKQTIENSKKDKYLRYLVDSYFRIEDCSKELANVSNPIDNSKKDYLKGKIRLDSTLMAYYIRRYPGYYRERNAFEMLLVDISRHPERKELYDELTDRFTKFCWGIEKKKRKNDQLTIRFDKIGYAKDDF